MNPKPNRGPLKQGKTGSRSIGPNIGAPISSDAPTDGAAAVAASVGLDISTNPTAADSVTIGGVGIVFDTDVAIGGSPAATQATLIAFINDLENGLPVSAGAAVDDVIPLTARTAGAAGNSIAVADDLTAEGEGFGGETTLTGGSDQVVASARFAGEMLVYDGKLFVSPDGETWSYTALSALADD